MSLLRGPGLPTALLAALLLAAAPAGAAPLPPSNLEKSEAAARHPRTLEFVLFGAAAACYAVAGGTLVSALPQRSRLVDLLAQTEARPDTAEAARLERTLVLKSRVINVALVAGSGLVLGGLVTAGVRRYRIMKESELTLSVLPGGGAVGLARAF